MARKSPSRLEMRKQVEAAEAAGTPPTEGAAAKKKVKEPKKKAAPRAKRTKVKAIIRKRLVWGVFSSSMKEEGRFPYADRDAAEARVVELSQKHKRTYFVQPIKEPLQDGAAPPAE